MMNKPTRLGFDGSSELSVGATGAQMPETAGVAKAEFLIGVDSAVADPPEGVDDFDRGSGLGQPV